MSSVQLCGPEASRSRFATKYVGISGRRTKDPFSEEGLLAQSIDPSCRRGISRLQACKARVPTPGLSHATPRGSLEPRQPPPGFPTAGPVPIAKPQPEPGHKPELHG